MKSRNY